MSAGCGTLEVRGSRVLFSLPPIAPSMLCLAFPGDDVPWPSWSSATEASGQHAHSSGLLSVLRKRFHHQGGAYSTAALAVVEPSRCSSSGHAHYENLLPCELSRSGAPLAPYAQFANAHKAASLLAAIIDAVRDAQGPSCWEAVPLVAIAFSKGAVVLNQLLAEASTLGRPPSASDEDARDAVAGRRRPGADAAAQRLLEQLREVHYVDAGLDVPGCYMTEASVIGGLSRRDHGSLAIAFHGTPRQWFDERRRWLREEKDRSVAQLRHAGLDVHEKVYLEDEPGSLSMHFACVELFDLTLCGSRVG